jgi:hypothetical protein
MLNPLLTISTSISHTKLTLPVLCGNAPKNVYPLKTYSRGRF